MIPVVVIDLGSNAIRFVAAHIEPSKKVTVLEKIRKPIRVGADVFSKGLISIETEKKLVETFRFFAREARHYRAEKTWAVGTSAFREAKNGKEVAKKIFESSGIKLDIISGKEEARIIQRALIPLNKIKDQPVLLIDIGGGSVELTCLNKGEVEASESFSLGTLRLLSGMEKEKVSQEKVPDYVKEKALSTKDFLESVLKKVKVKFCVGTGGNFEDLLNLKKRLIEDKDTNMVGYDDLCKISKRLLQTSYTQRIEKYDLRHDRADVIIPASFLAKSVMKLSGVEDLFIPRRGLKEGLLEILSDSI